MGPATIGAVDLTVEPDLQPLYPTPAQISDLLSPHAGLSPTQKAELVSHCLAYVDLSKQDEDGLGLISTAILGFGSESERDIEREECVRLLVSEGCDVNTADYAGWTPLHYASLLSPPTLVSYLLTHGSSPLALTRRRLTPLDIVTAHSTLPGREDVALLLEEAMREAGWKGGRMEEQRRSLEKRMRRLGKRRRIQEEVERVLGINPKWWGEDDTFFALESEEDADDNPLPDSVLVSHPGSTSHRVSQSELQTPPPDFSSMLVFSPMSLPDIFQSLITDFQPSLRNAEPANALYMLARFACLNCDHNWVEDLIIGATDAIEDVFFSHAEDPTYLIFWLYNTTIWLHLMRCDKAVSRTCDALGSLALIEEILNSVFVFIIRFAERRIDTLLDAALLDYSPLSSEFESIQFESEWSFLRSFAGGKKKANGATSASAASTTFSRTRAPSSATPLQSLFSDASPGSQTTPKDVISFMTALHTILILSGINPALITQFWSQVMYWTACEIFNRVLTRKKYLCRSRAVQISMNLGVIEEWISQMELPRGVGSHFAPVHDLLNWLQCLSSIAEFPNLIATIQTMKHLNPLQMRRAVRDYRYEVNEGRMTEECNQYLAQLQKDWERHRIKIGVEQLRREVRTTSVTESVKDEGSVSASPSLHDVPIGSDQASSSSSQENSAAQRSVDALFDRTQERLFWEPAKDAGSAWELLDSRYMLPLLLPSDPRMLGALPTKPPGLHLDDGKRSSVRMSVDSSSSRSESRASFSSRGAMGWRFSKQIRDIGPSTLQYVDGIRAAARWTRPVELEEDEGDSKAPPPYASDDANDEDIGELKLDTQVVHLTALTRAPSGRSRGRASVANGTPIDQSGDPLASIS
ncbi:hypothetical protein BN946_scf185013.g124 [Trametes cinnabarina]|uniref:Dilute domain-containing protein n=1 Tax=Pycnoporus cinnabarinus TaxID=5643 RepID=A0A060SMN3_PYCCI|nr:hypothetical protein BN946_scf185013.g124 [Trametes cinnabarina]